jgi:hypothetical protein
VQRSTATGGRGLNPRHQSTHVAHRRRETVDVLDDLARDRNFKGKIFSHEVVLHADNDEGVSFCINCIVLTNLPC